MFPQRCLFGLWSSGLWHRVVRSVDANRCHFPNTHLLWPEPIHFPEFSLSPSSMFLLWAEPWTPTSLDVQQKINRRGYNRQCRVRDMSQDRLLRDGDRQLVISDSAHFDKRGNSSFALFLFTYISLNAEKLREKRPLVRLKRRWRVILKWIWKK
jgi:hypothetical protein